MNRLLIRLFIKDHQNIHDPAVRSSYGMLAGMAGICTNTLLAAGKIIIGVVSGSIALLADGVNNLTDAGSSVVTLAGFRLARRPRDKEHPFGHARYEYIAGLVISIVIILFGVQLTQTSIGKILHPALAEYNKTIALVLLAAILIKLWQCLFYRYIYKKLQSMTIKAAAKDSRNDVITTLGVGVSLYLGDLTGWALWDGMMGSIIGLAILVSGVMLIKETISPLLGVAPDKAMIDKLEEKLLSYQGVLGIHDLVVHEYGQGRLFATVHAEVCCEEELLKSHDLIDNIERDIGEEMGMNLVIHMDPINTTDQKTLALRERVQVLVKEIDEALSMHDFRIISGPTHTNIIFDVVLPVESKLSEEELKQTLASKIKALSDQETYYALITVDRSYA